MSLLEPSTEMMLIGVDASSSGSQIPLLFAENIILSREEAKSRGFPFVV